MGLRGGMSVERKLWLLSGSSESVCSLPKEQPEVYMWFMGCKMDHP